MKKTSEHAMPKTLTDAIVMSGVVAMYVGENLSSARTVPYAEFYRQQTGLIETPVQMIQRAADDEEKRVAGR